MSIRDFSAVESQLQPTRPVDRQAVIAQLLQTLASNDFAALPQYLSENVQFQIYGFPALNGAWHGREAVVAALTANFSRISEQKTTLRGLVQQGDLLALRVHEAGQLEGTPYEVEAVFWMVFDGPVLSEITEFVHCL